MSKLGNYYVKWDHKEKNTTCFISKDYKVLAAGIATKHPTDRPDHRIARRISFQRAMNFLTETHEVPKEEIANVWEDYLEKVRQPNKNP